MPITRRQFELGISPEMEEWLKRIYALLAGEKDKAFTFDEIEDHCRSCCDLDVWTRIRHSGIIPRALDKLVELKAVEERTIGGKSYYSCGGELPQF